MGNVLSEAKREQVIALGRLGWSLRRIEQETGVRRETAGGYLRSRGIAMRASGRLGDADSPCKTGHRPDHRLLMARDSKPAMEVTTDFLARQRRGGAPASASACELYRETDRAGAVARPQRDGDLAGSGRRPRVSGGYQSVKRFVRKLRGRDRRKRGWSSKLRLAKKAQVDYGTGPMVRDPESGKYRRTRMFVLTLGYSRKSVRLLGFRSSARIWAELHEKAFRRLGGSTRIVVLDNLREGVLSPTSTIPA